MSKALCIFNEMTLTEENDGSEEEQAKWVQEQKKLISDLEASNHAILKQSEKVLASSKEKRAIA